MLSRNIEDTTKIAKAFLNKILRERTKRDEALVITLSGDLGVGKTVFVQAAAKFLSIKSKVKSPTFVIMKKYPLKNTKYKFLFHLDAYRLKNEKELLRLGWEEIISKKEHLIFIEWPENVSKVIPAKAKRVHISHTKKGHRNFKIG